MGCPIVRSARLSQIHGHRIVFLEHDVLLRRACRVRHLLAAPQRTNALYLMLCRRVVELLYDDRIPTIENHGLQLALILGFEVLRIIVSW